MPITVVSSLPKSAPPAVADNAVDSAASAANPDSTTGSQGFQSLLLALGQQLATPSATGSLAISSQDPAATDKTDTADATAGDTSGLLAALGIIPVEIRPEPATNRGNGAPGADAIGQDRTRNTANAGNSSTASRAETQSLLGEASAANAQGKTAKIAADAMPFAATEIKSGKEGASENVSAPNPMITPETKTNTTTAHDTPLSIRTPVQTADWGHELGQKIVWMATHDKQSAQITLNPEQMGPIEVSLSVDKGNVTASFASSSADVREAIETALPRLREMFASAGIELGQTNVSAESFRQPTPDQGTGSNRSTANNGNGILTTAAVASTTTGSYATRQGNSLVDIFA